ncbi:MAG: structural protein P5 [Bacteroidales bacterium]|nr:structural protein P5 [Bacteroidales bacterium]
MTRGLRNHNPLNIRKSGDRFKGEVVPSSDAAFKQFLSDAYGYRAAFVILATYLKQGRNTIVAIVARWAPAADNNNTARYIENVERRSGIDRFQPLTAASGNDYIRIVAAMSQSENGVPAVMEDVVAGFNLQNRITR